MEPGSTSRDVVEGFVREHEAYVRALAARLAPDPAQADDLAQETFLVAFRKRESLDLSRDIRPWLATIVRNLSHRAWEKALRENRLRRDALSLFVEQLPEDASELYEGNAKAALRKCLDKLPERSRTLLNLRYNLGLPSEETAQHTASTAEAVRMALVRVRQALRQCMDKSLRGAEA